MATRGNDPTKWVTVDADGATKQRNLHIRTYRRLGNQIMCESFLQDQLL